MDPRAGWRTARGASHPLPVVPRCDTRPVGRSSQRSASPAAIAARRHWPGRLIPRDGGSLLVPAWVPQGFFLAAIVLIPWTAWLFASLPPHHVANHWRLAWGGFDVGLSAALAATAVLVARRSPLAEITATVTATLLVCDAWFDVLTSRGTSQMVQAAVLAALVELPLAVLCLWIARNVERALEVARPYLERAGFAIRGRRVVPPSAAADPGDDGDAPRR